MPIIKRNVNQNLYDNASTLAKNCNNKLPIFFDDKQLKFNKFCFKLSWGAYCPHWGNSAFIRQQIIQKIPTFLSDEKIQF